MNRQNYHNQNHQNHHQNNHHHRPQNRDNEQLRFRKPTLYPITNKEPVPLQGERDRRQFLAVICQNNPTHIVSYWNIQEHLQECDELAWRPAQHIPPPPQMS